MAELVKLGRYQLRRVLGKGAMGVVYEGFDPTLSRRVAVKTILKSAAHDKETERAYSERFVREAQAVARLNHPNIVQVHDFGEQDNIAYLVMEFIQGQELRSVIGTGERVSLVECVRIMSELLGALDFAHEAGVVHRDVKPANVMVDAQRQVKLTDFGVARVQDANRSAEGTMVGTPSYMSPEQIQGHKIDRRTDIFSSGVILYQLLTGEQPFKGEGAWTVAKKIMQDDPPLPSTLVTSVSPIFDDIVERALAKAPADRYANAREFAAALKDALNPAQTTSPYAPKPKVRAAAKAIDAEIEFWRSIQNSKNVEEFKVYLQQFPQGTYARLARVKLDSLQAPQVQTPPKSDIEDSTVATAESHATGAHGRTWTAQMSIALAVVAAGIGLYIYSGRTPAPAPAPIVADQLKQEVSVVPQKPDVTVAEIEKIKKETEERIQREYAEKAVAEQAAVAKAANEKSFQEKQLVAKAAIEKSAAEKTAAEKVASARTIAATEAAERLTREREIAEKAAADRIAAEKVSAEKAAAEKATADSAAAAKAKSAATKPGWPSVGDRWVYEVREILSGKTYRLSVDATSVTPDRIVDITNSTGSTPSETMTHGGDAFVTGLASGAIIFSPYLQAFRRLNGYDRWSEIEFTNLQTFGGNEGGLVYDISARVTGHEIVSVPAGKYATTRITVSIKSSAGRLQQHVELNFWYAEDIRRFVKGQARTSNNTWLRPSFDMNLISYTPAPPR